MRQAIVDALAVALAVFGLATTALALVPSPWLTDDPNPQFPCILCTEQACSGAQPPCAVYAGCAAVGDNSCVGCFCKQRSNRCECQRQN